MADLEELFRWLHRHPELAFAEVGATARVKELLTHPDLLDMPADTPVEYVIRR